MDRRVAGRLTTASPWTLPWTLPCRSAVRGQVCVDQVMHDLGDGVQRLVAAPTLFDAADALHATAGNLGAGAVSIGVLRGGDLACATRGFPGYISGAFSTVPVEAQLPGPSVVRTGSPLFFTDRISTLRRFPTAAAILNGTVFGAAA